ncbi:hypothetical protein BpHYR1_033942 [Brachionus plicatilis]|uniref:Uncharacterized protein n=1 Tax=Brachionus plicatilis TaxID=10195 RepID=A0A3M7PYJ3_BRAPC|nr:hypothetical protein BpHYR1_033942 [Brachionus plicatilis]
MLKANYKLAHGGTQVQEYLNFLKKYQFKNQNVLLLHLNREFERICLNIPKPESKDFHEIKFFFGPFCGRPSLGWSVSWMATSRSVCLAAGLGKVGLFKNGPQTVGQFMDDLKCVC